MGKKIRLVLSRESFEELEAMRKKLNWDYDIETYEDYLKAVDEGRYDCYLF